MDKVTLHVDTRWDWFRWVGPGLGLAFALTAIYLMAAGGERHFTPAALGAIYFSYLTLVTLFPRFTLLTAHVLWQSNHGSIPLALITQIQPRGRSAYLVEWGSRVKRRTTLTMTPAMATEAMHRSGQASDRDREIASTLGLAPTAWTPVADLSISQYGGLIFLPIFLAPMLLHLSEWLGTGLPLLLAPLVGFLLTHHLPRLQRVLADGNLFEIGPEGITRQMSVVGATIEPAKYGRYQLRKDGDAFLLNRGQIASRLLGQTAPPAKRGAAQPQQGRCILCGDPIADLTAGTVAVCDLCANRVRYEAERTGHSL